MSNHILREIVSDDQSLYDEGDFIGEGGFAEVSICTKKGDKSHKEFAMKTIRKNKRGFMAASCEDFGLEVEIQSKLKHPNIIQIKDSYETPDQYKLILEYCNGNTLLNYVQNHGKLSKKVVVKIMTKLLSAVEYMHKMGVVHRDLKLENIVLENKDDPTSVKIIDFGHAAYFEEGQRLYGKKGTRIFKAPEISKGCYDNKCDIYSLGVIAYSMLFAAYPSDDDNQVTRV